MTQTLIRPDGTALTYDKFVPEKPASDTGIVFMHGFKSDRKATKVSYVHEWCQRQAVPFVGFDFFAHGESGGDWADFTIGRAVHDALLALDSLTDGPQIIMGSSMGGWVALRLMEERPECVAGLIGIAAAPDFSKWVEAAGTPEQRRAEGFTDTLMAEAQSQYVVGEDWAWQGPVHLLQGQMDDDVPWQTADAIRNKFVHPEAATVTYVQDGDHRLNRPEDLKLLETAIIDVKSRL